VKFLSLLIVVSALSGCAAKYDQISLSNPEAAFSKDDSVVIATPDNGFYETTEYRSSGRMTALAVRSSFSKYSRNVTVESDCKKLKCLKDKYPREYRYYVVPEILHWEERATEWSGRPDRIEVQLIIFEYGSWREIASTHIKAKSKWLTFGGDHPQDLLAKPINDYVTKLYGM
jgi:hypothetical protein